MEKKSTPHKRKESHAGFHYANLFQCCQRKWYFRYLKGWRPKIIGKPLVLGSAFHEGKAEWYKGKSAKVCKETALEVLEESKKELDHEDYLDIEFRVPILLDYWIDQFGKLDRREYKVLAVEKELRVPILETGFYMTLRPDTVLQAKSEKSMVIIMETKTSGFSHRITGEAVYYGDQATTYSWGVRKVMGVEPFAVQPDIAYWNKVTKDVNNIKMIRPAMVYRDEATCRRYEMGIAQVFNEMSQKAEAYKNGANPWILFPRNSHYCLSFSTPCEFAEICYQDCEKIKRPPRGFRKVGGVKPLGGYVEDSIAAN